LFCGAAGLADLRVEWQLLQTELPGCTFYQTWEWHHAVLSCLLPDTSHSFYVGAYSGRNLKAVIPLRWSACKHMGIPVKCLTFNSHPHVILHDFVVDAAYEDAINWKSVVRFAERELAVRFDRIELRGTPDHSAANRIVRGNSILRRAPHRVDGCAIVSCAGSFEENTAQLSARALRNIRRLERRALRRGPVEFAKFRGHFPDKVLEEFMQIENDSWKGVRGTSILGNSSLQRFYSTLAAEADDRHPCQINFLSVAGKPVAAQFGIVSGGMFHILKLGYRQDSADIGPGNLLLKYTLKDASRNTNIDAINLLTEPAWSKNWARRTDDVHVYSEFRPTVCGCMLFMMAGAQHLMSRISQAIRRAVSGLGRPPPPVLAGRG
jgi:CelD/BcsL family acetyltransferase involved in cellulose biosynthesis